MRPEKLGTYIRSLRIQNGMTQAELAEQLHLTDKAISKWERNLSYPDISLLPQLASILGVTVSDLLCEMDDGGPPSRLLQVIQMSNDIRSPVHVILGCAELVDRYCDDPEKRARYLDGIRVSAKYLLDRLDQIRKVAQQSRLQEQQEIPGYIQMEEPNSAPALYDFTGKRILVAEDNEINREIAGSVLKHTGAEVEFAEDGVICVEKVNKAPEKFYDVILMDISMPNMDGIDAARHIRSNSNKAKAQIPIIAVTAETDEIVRGKAIAAGINAFTEKPIFVDRLFVKIQEFL